MADSQPQTSTSREIEAVVLNGPPYLATEKPFLTQADIAEELDVSRETVRTHIEDVADHPLIRAESVGQAKVYWRAYSPDDDWGDEADNEVLEQIVAEFVEEQEMTLVMRRALWLQTKQELVGDTSNPVSPNKRLQAWDRLLDYFEIFMLVAPVRLSAALAEKSIPEEYADVGDVSEDAYDEGLFRYGGFDPLRPALLDVPLFASPLDVELTGLVMLHVHHRWMVQEIDEETSQERLGEIVPSAKDISHAGAVFDRFAVRLHGFDW